MLPCLNYDFENTFFDTCSLFFVKLELFDSVPEIGSIPMRDL